MPETARLEVLLVCPECSRHVRPSIQERHFVQRETVANTLPEYPLESGVISHNSLIKLTVTCPVEGCGGKWDVWPDEAGL